VFGLYAETSFLVHLYPKKNDMFIEIEVKLGIVVHGYDNENKEIE
jgi:hypothetical protein